MKGKSELVAAFCPTFEQPAFLTRQEVVVGRASEQVAIRERLAAITERDCAPVLIFEREAGIGKSLLLRETLRQAQERGVACWSGGPDAIRAPVPYNGWRSIFLQIFELQKLIDPVARRDPGGAPTRT